MTSRSRTRRSIGAGARSRRRPFIAQQHNVVLVGGTGTGKTRLAIRPKLHPTKIARALLYRRRSCESVEAESRAGRQGGITDYLNAYAQGSYGTSVFLALTALEETAKTELLGFQEPRS